MPIAERMKLAEGRPLRRRMMAAMAQQDCGQCGYNCHDYSEALAGKSEARLNLCVPGGKETARMLKSLHEELSSARRPPRRRLPRRRSDRHAPASAPGRSRDNPAEATFLSRRRLNKEGSEKDTWHLEFDLAESQARLCGRRLVRCVSAERAEAGREVMAALGAPPDFAIGGRTLRQVLTDQVSLSPAPDSLFQLLSYITGGDRRQKAQGVVIG